MRRLVLALCLLASVRATATSCVTVIPRGLTFFDRAEAVFFARAEVTLPDFPFVLRAEEIVRGTMTVGEAVTIESRVCVVVNHGARYLVSRVKCDQPEPCVQFVDEPHAAALLEYFAHAHSETHEAVIAKVLRWYRREISLEQLDEWLGTVAIQPRSREDDLFVLDLVSNFTDLTADLRLFPQNSDTDEWVRTQLRDVARALEAFPPGPIAEFDARVDATGDEDAPRREQLEEQLHDAITKVRDRSEWQERLEQAEEVSKT